MITTLNINNKLTLLYEMSSESTFQVLEYDYLKGVNNINSVNDLKSLKDLDVKLKQVRILLNESEVKLRSGVLSYMRGNIIVNNKSKVQMTLGNKIFRNKHQKNIEAKQLLQGTGEVFLEPSFNDFILLELEDEEIMINEDIFYACEGNIEVTAFTQKNISSIDYSCKKSQVIKLKGAGIVVLQVQVPSDEIIRCKIYKDRIVTNDDCIILWTNNIQHTVKKVSTELVNGEGCSVINIYSGIGEVWLLPTKKVYEKINITRFDEEIYDEDVDYED